MESLIALVKFVGKRKAKQIEIIGNENYKERKLDELFEGIIDEKFKTDLQACQYLYGTNDMTKGYRNLKSRLEKRLINTLFFTDVNAASYSNFQKAYYNCYKNLAAVKFLFGKGVKNAGAKLAEKTLTHSLRYELHDISIPLLLDLRYYHGVLLGSKKKFKQYNQLLHQLQEDRKYEERSRELFEKLGSEFSNSKSITSEHKKMAEEFSNEIKGYLDKSNYSKFQIYAYQLFTIECQINNDHHGTIRVCDKAISNFEKIEFIPQSQIFAFTFKRFASHLQLKNYELAEADGFRCLQMAKEGSVNWFIVSKFFIVLLFYTNRMQEAFEFYKKVKDILRKNKKTLGVGKEFWNIIEGYMNYFTRIGKIKLPDNQRGPRFSSKNFIRSVPIFSKDKRGMNISILILQILFFLLENKFNDVIDRTDTLKTYCSRYLRNDENFRSNCFIKMLAKIPEANFNRIALERRTNDLYERLKSKPFEEANQPIETEVVPLEMLWEIVLESLEKKKR